MTTGYIVTVKNIDNDVLSDVVNQFHGIVLSKGIDQLSFFIKGITALSPLCMAYTMRTQHVISDDSVTVKKQDFTGYVFYAEYASPQDKKKDVANSPKKGLQTLQYTNGNVMAVFPKQQNRDHSMYSFGTLMSEPNPNTTQLCHGSISHDYLDKYCKRINLEQAIRLHPNMFLSGEFDAEE